jgi:hypothetical protein
MDENDNALLPLPKSNSYKPVHGGYPGQTPEGVGQSRIGKSWAIRTEFHIGLGFRYDGEPIPEPMVPSIRRGLLGVVSDAFGGATMIPHYGAWNSPEGKLCVESGCTIIAYGHSNEMSTIAERLLALSGQRAIVVVTIGPRVEAREVFRRE